MRGSKSDEISFLVKTDMRRTRESPTGEDVLSRQHGFRKAPVRVEVQCQLQIFAARAAGLGVRLTPELRAKYPYVPGSTSMFG